MGTRARAQRFCSGCDTSVPSPQQLVPVAAVSSAMCQTGQARMGCWGSNHKDKARTQSTAELEQMHLPGEDGVRHCQHPAHLTSSSALDWQQCPGLAEVPWWHWHSSAMAQHGPSSSSQAASAPAPAASFHLPLTHSSAGSGTAPSLGTAAALTLPPALLVLLGQCSRAGDTKAQHKLCASVPFSSLKNPGLTSMARCPPGSLS